MLIILCKFNFTLILINFSRRSDLRFSSSFKAFVYLIFVGIFKCLCKFELLYADNFSFNVSAITLIREFWY
jgi:hypothetical protein